MLIHCPCLSSHEGVDDQSPAYLKSRLDETEALLQKALSWVANLKQHLPEPPTATEYSLARRHNSGQLVSKLPPEILSNIFLFLYGSAVDPSRIPLQDFKPWIKPFAELSVCVFWRDCIISIPALWTVLWLRGSMEEAPKLEYLERLAARSKGLSFQLRVVFDHRMVAHIEDVGIALQKHFPRCRSLHLWFENATISQTVFPLPWNVSNLAELSVRNDSWDYREFEDPDAAWLAKLVWGRPALKILSIKDYFGRLQLGPVLSAFQTIEFLELETRSVAAPTYSWFCYVLPLLPKLKGLCLTIDTEEEQAELTPVTLPSLERLAIVGGYNHFITTTIVAPRLKVLHLGIVRSREGRAIGAIEDFQTSERQWRELSLGFEEHRPRDILRLRGVTHLTYENSKSAMPFGNLFDGLLDELDGDTGRPFPLKKSLKRLNLHIRELLYADEHRRYKEPRQINTRNLQEFSAALSGFMRNAQGYPRSLRVYLDVDIDEFPILEEIADANQNDSLDLYFGRNTWTRWYTREGMAETFRRKWRPSWRGWFEQ